MPKKNVTKIKHFKRLRKLGEGTYGVVYKAMHHRSKQVVALKKIRTDEYDEGMSTTTLREIALLKSLNKHANIVKLYDLILSPHEIYLVFEFCSYDIKSYLNKHISSLTPQKIANITQQILNGIHFCHSKRIFHRDLKPQNILINESTEIVKIADFGLARNYMLPYPSYTHEVVTLWYRSPDILLGSKKYFCETDIWSIGCIFAEICNYSQPLFRGNSEICQLIHIFRCLGTPTNSTWPGVTKLRHWNYKLPQWKPKPWHILLPKMNYLAQDLLSRMLQLDPRKRITAGQALKHPFFKHPELPQSDLEIQDNQEQLQWNQENEENDDNYN